MNAEARRKHILGSEGPHTLAVITNLSSSSSCDFMTVEMDTPLDTTVINVCETTYPAEAGEKSFKTFLTNGGRLLSWGTCHKGVLANISRKPKLCDTYDELSPYAVASVMRNAHETTFRQPATDVNSLGTLNNVVQVAVGSIHCLALNSNGDVYSFGCGSGGRCGVEVRNIS